MLGAPAWLAYTALEGTFAYDAATYPATESVFLGAPSEGLVINNVMPSWSPDGARLAYFAGDHLEVREMTTHLPSMPVAFAQGLVSFSSADSLAWSPDGKAVSFISGPALYIADPAVGAAAPHLVTPGYVPYYQWAPAGDGLVFQADDGFNYVRVRAGVPDAPQELARSRAGWAWSRDGSKLIVQDGLDIILFDTSGTTVTRTPVVTNSSERVAGAQFDFDGSLFSLYTEHGLSYASTSAPTALTLLSPVSGAVPDYARWHPKEPVLAFTVNASPTAVPDTWYYVTFGGDIASAPARIPGAWQLVKWLPDRLALLAEDQSKGWSLVDLTGVTPVVTPYPLADASGFYVTPARAGDTVAFSANQFAILASLSDPTLPTHSVTSTQGDVNGLDWSHTAEYLAILSAGPETHERLNVTRVDGTVPSPVKAVQASMPTTAVRFFWQP